VGERRRHFRLGKGRSGRPFEPFVVERNRIGVVEDDHFPPTRPDRRIQCFAWDVDARRRIDPANVRIFRDDLPRAVRRTVVHRDDFKAPGTALAPEALQRPADVRVVVVRPHDDADDRVFHNRPPVRFLF